MLLKLMSTLPNRIIRQSKTNSPAPENAPAGHGRELCGSEARRCSVKGCIFPAASSGGNLCLLHALEEEDPRHFLSIQPSSLCLDRARIGIGQPSAKEGSKRERRKLAFQSFLLCNEVA